MSETAENWNPNTAGPDCDWCGECDWCSSLGRTSEYAPHGHAQAPADPYDGLTFTCERCGYSAEFVVLDDGVPGEWVAAPPNPTEEAPDARA